MTVSSFMPFEIINWMIAASEQGDTQAAAIIGAARLVVSLVAKPVEKHGHLAYDRLDCVSRVEYGPAWRHGWIGRGAGGRELDDDGGQRWPGRRKEALSWKSLHVARGKKRRRPGGFTVAA
jgi:hypothetical protein